MDETYQDFSVDLKISVDCPYCSAPTGVHIHKTIVKNHVVRCFECGWYFNVKFLAVVSKMEQGGE